MMIKVKRNGKTYEVDVRDEKCRKRKCLSIHKYQHINHSKTEGCMTNVDDFYSCAVRNYNGCPEESYED